MTARAPTTTSTRRKGVRGRNSDNTLILERLGWEPSDHARDGMEQTYAWIYDQMASGNRAEMAGRVSAPHESLRPCPGGGVAWLKTNTMEAGSCE